MTRARIFLPSFGSILGLWLSAAPVWAGGITVLTAGAYKPVLMDLTKEFEARTGDVVTATNDTGGALAARIAGGEAADLVILPRPNLEPLAAAGRIVKDSLVTVAKSGIGAAVKTGAPVPDISTVESFKKTLLTTPSVAYIDPASGGSSGIYLAKLFDQLGIGAVMKPRSVLVQGGLAATRVANGDAALALQQMSELRAVKGVTLAGPLPAAIQSYTFYATAIPTAAKNPDGGRKLAAWLRSDAGIRALTARGLEQP